MTSVKSGGRSGSWVKCSQPIHVLLHVMAAGCRAPGHSWVWQMPTCAALLLSAQRGHELCLSNACCSALVGHCAIAMGKPTHPCYPAAKAAVALLPGTSGKGICLLLPSQPRPVPSPFHQVPLFFCKIQPRSDSGPKLLIFFLIQNSACLLNRACIIRRIVLHYRLAWVVSTLLSPHGPPERCDF